MFSSFFSFLQSTFVPPEAGEAPEAGPAADLKQRLAAMPPHQAQSLGANEDLRGFLASVMRHHEEARIANGEWIPIAAFLMGGRNPLPPSVVHLAPQWPRAREAASTLIELLRPGQWSTDTPPGHTIARFQVLLAHLKAQARVESWLSHGFKTEFQALCHDPDVGPLDRIEVLDVAVLQLGPMGEEQLRISVDRLARLQRLLSPDAYPCIHDVLSRMANEARWQLDLFNLPEEPLLPGFEDAPRSQGRGACTPFGAALTAEHQPA